MLIDSIVQQTTVLVGQLATAAGIRAPLAHIADQVFVELAQELRAQGVSGRVAAGMFGMTLRSYQKRLRRLRLSETREGSLWEAVFAFVREGGNVRRTAILQHFRRDPEREIGAVLNDLVASGLLTQTGRGAQAVYAPTSEAGLEVLRRGGDRDSMLELIWLTVSDHPGLTRTEVEERFPEASEPVGELLDQLVREGKIQATEQNGELTYRAQAVLIPVGAEAGWEVAVFDHYRAMVNAVAVKLRQGNTRSSTSDETGGATLSFELSPGHPYEERVRSLLRRERELVGELWQDVERHNAAHPLPEDASYRVYFYFGQYVEEEEE